MTLRFIKKSIRSVLGIIAIATCIFWVFGTHTLHGFGNTLIYSSVVIFVLSFFFLGNNRVSGYRRKPFISSDSDFMKAREVEKPFEETIWSITAGAIFVFAVGNVLTLL